MSPLLPQLKAAKNALEDAHIRLCGAVTAHAEAKRTLELEEARKLCEGVEGKNEKERSARLLRELYEHVGELHKTEDALAEARCAYEVARLEWDLCRYQVRVLEMTVPLERAA